MFLYVYRFVLWVLSFVIPGLGMFSEAYYVFAVGNLKRECCNSYAYYENAIGKYKRKIPESLFLHVFHLQQSGRWNILHAGLRIPNAPPNCPTQFLTPKSEVLSAVSCFWVLSLTGLVVNWGPSSRQPRCSSVPFSLQLRTVLP